MTTGSSFRRPPTAQEAVLAEVRDEIVRGRLRPGERVVQDALAERYGVSRVPLREALKILEGEGLVVYHPHRGYHVAELSVADLLEVYRLRALLEAEALRVGVPLMRAEDLDRVEGLLADVSRAAADGDLVALTAANRRFHFALFEAADMPRLLRLLRQLWDATDAYRTVYFGSAANRRRVEREHEELMRAVRSGDAEMAISLQAGHREHSVDVVRQVIESGDRQDYR